MGRASPLNISLLLLGLSLLPCSLLSPFRPVSAPPALLLLLPLCILHSTPLPDRLHASPFSL